MILTMTMLQLFEHMLTATSPTSTWTRAAENLNGVPADLLQRFPRLFASEFYAGSMSLAGREWLDAFPGAPAAKQVANGIGWVFDKTKGNFAEGDFDEYRQEDNFKLDDPEAKAAIIKEIKSLLKSRRILDVTDDCNDIDIVKRVLPVFAIHQGDKWRVVWDGRKLNQDVHNPSFTMETAATAARMLKPGDFLFTIDQWAGYHQLLLQPNLRPYCCFAWGEGKERRVYQWQVLPFGLNVAPRRYTEVMELLFGLWRAQGIRCAMYLDDGLFAASSYEEACRVREIVLTDLERFGFLVNKDKAHLIPAQAVRYLGHVYDTSGDRVRLFIPDDKADKLVKTIDNVLTDVDQGRRQLPPTKSPVLSERSSP